jgi:alpha-beta hydrolase superfamily lysophospholipase
MPPARISLSLAAIALVLTGQGCAGLVDRSMDPLEGRARAIARELGALEDAALPQDGDAARLFFDFADQFDDASGAYSFSGRRILGTIDSGGYAIGAVLLLPAGASPRGTIFAIHGYLSYSGAILGPLERLADEGWAVLAADLPGHGFSEGKRGDIGDFADYGLFAAGLPAWAEAQGRYDLPRPFVYLSHSAGGVAVLESLWGGAARAGARVDSAVLLAPLVRPVVSWAAPIAGLLSPFVGSFPARRDDDGYLGLPRMPLHWVQALVAWNRRLEARPALDLPVLIVQGRADTVVDWRWNLPFLLRKIPGAEAVYLDGRGHMLPGHGGARDESLAAVEAFLDARYPRRGPGWTEEGRDSKFVDEAKGES